MFRILIVEDDILKLRNIVQNLVSSEGIDEELIDHVVDSKSAKIKLKEKFYDLLIVDIAIPSQKSKPIDIDGGIHLVKEILTREIYHIPSHIIGMTAREEVFNKATEEFNDEIISVIRYSDIDNEWEKKLRKGVIQWVNSKLKLAHVKLDYDYDLAVITAVEVEFNAVKNLFSNWKRVIIPNDSTPYWETSFEHNGRSLKVINCCLSQMGMNACAVLSMKVIHNFRPRFLFMPGITASIKDSFSHGYGDVLVIDESWDGGAGKIKQNNNQLDFEPVALHIRLDRDLSEKMRAFKENKALLRTIKDNFKQGKVPNTELTIHLGSVVSVAGVIANEEVSQELKRKDRKLLGLEMEAYGLYYSAANCSSPRPRAMVLKSVCDYADNSKDDSYQTYAAFTSAQIMYEFFLGEC